VATSGSPDHGYQKMSRLPTASSGYHRGQVSQVKYYWVQAQIDRPPWVLFRVLDQSGEARRNPVLLRSGPRYQRLVRYSGAFTLGIHIEAKQPLIWRNCARSRSGRYSVSYIGEEYRRQFCLNPSGTLRNIDRRVNILTVVRSREHLLAIAVDSSLRYHFIVVVYFPSFYFTDQDNIFRQSHL